MEEKDMYNKMITAVYCRTASKNDDAVALQEMSLRNYAEKHGYDNIVVYVDNGFNGLNYDRPAFTQMNNDINAGIVDVVLVNDVSRIGRNSIEIHYLINTFMEKGTTFISVSDGLDDKSINEMHDTLNQLFDNHCAKQRRKAANNKK
jgi:DNA invertase Pin-like site-specific DNA recombinase